MARCCWWDHFGLYREGLKSDQSFPEAADDADAEGEAEPHQVDDDDAMAASPTWCLRSLG